MIAGITARKTVTRYLIVICLLCAGSQLYADDGSWSKSFTLEGGSIYAEEENSSVELVSELLVFDGKKTTAYFLFRNTTAKDLSVKCGFPVKNSIDSEIIDGYAYIWTGKYGRGGVPALKWFDTVPITDVADPADEETLMLAASEVVPLTEQNKRRNFISPGEMNEDVSLSIFQDRKKVAIDRILIEREINYNGIGITYHYQHELKFPAKKETVVVVEYTQDLLKSDVGAGMGYEYEWNYIISTGRTWKGSIGGFCLVVPEKWYGTPERLDKAGTFGGYNIYFKKSYEPRSFERFSLSRDEQNPNVYWYMEGEEMMEAFKMQYTKKSGLSAPVKPVQDFVSAVSASSQLDQKVSVFTEKGIIENTGFTAVSAFDGYSETAWCENVSGDGEGQYLEFTISEPIIGLEIINGFTRFTLPQDLFDTGIFEEHIKDDKKGLKDYYSLNGSVSGLQITDQKGKKLYLLPLARTRDPQLMIGAALGPGTYRAVIKGVKRGSKWRDTCIGEISFIPESQNKVLQQIGKDGFIMDSLRKFFLK